jgi:hypothetical protein
MEGETMKAKTHRLKSQRSNFMIRKYSLIDQWLPKQSALVVFLIVLLAVTHNGLAEQTAVIDMVPGRLNKVPVSGYYKATFSSATGLHVKTLCLEDSDSGMLLESNAKALFNDDSSLAGGNGKGSYLRSPISQSVSTGIPTSYNVYVFSMRRASSSCRLFISRDNGKSWEIQPGSNDVDPSIRFGGTLVKVGPLRAGDYLEVQTADNGKGVQNLTDTDMLLFDAADAQKAVKYSNDQSSSDADPRINITDTSWQVESVFALLGKRSSIIEPIAFPDEHVKAWRNKGVEVYVDLVRGPLNAEQQNAAFPASGGEGTPVMLQPGRYYAWIYARTNFPVGELNVNPADAMPHDFCPAYPRGLMNNLSFTFVVERLTGAAGDLGIWQPATGSRAITKAALGSGADDGWNLFLLSMKVEKAGRYRIVTRNVAGSIIFHNEWSIMRNPDASEITVATFNTLYDGGYQDEKTRNASNLLATRGRIAPGTLVVEERPDQAPWQWNADIIGLQELKKSGDGCDQSDPDPDCFRLADVFVDEAEKRGSRRWKYVKGRDEDFTWGHSGLGPLFFGENVWPNDQENSIYFSVNDKSEAGCNGDSIDYAECHLPGCDSTWCGAGQLTNFGVPGKASVRRYGDRDRPLVVFNVHLERHAPDSDHRIGELDSLISKIDRLLQVDPGAFNSDVENPGRTHPKFYQNRIIILGDANFMSHSCGEHYWILKKLRDHYGYAVDVSMIPVKGGDHFGMHDTMDPSGGYQSYENWRASPNYTSSSVYPWWAATYRGDTDRKNGKSERHDVILLIGKGWAYDDPVREYMIMSDRDDPSPLNPKGGGVEMWQSADNVTDGANNYAPNYSLGSGTTAGKPALHSDHQPVGAKLRIFLR